MKKLILGLVITSIGSLFGAEKTSLPQLAALSKKKIPGKFELDMFKEAGATHQDFHLLLKYLKQTTDNLALFHYVLSEPVQIAFSHLISSDPQDAARVISLYEEIVSKKGYNSQPLKEEWQKRYHSLCAALHYKLYHQIEIENPHLLLTPSYSDKFFSLGGPSAKHEIMLIPNNEI